VQIALDELAGIEGMLDKVIVGGPTNSLMVHGTGERRGFFPERKVVVRKDATTGEQEWVASYHMTNPKKITMAERRELVDRVAGMLRAIQVTCPEAEVDYISMFPRFVKKCCNEHMSDEDVCMTDGIRRDVDRDIREMLEDGVDGVTVVDWWDILGLDGDVKLDEIANMRIIYSDGVHLSNRANRCAAVSLCDRYRIRTVRGQSGRNHKRRRVTDY
jgi:hypothetical protein